MNKILHRVFTWLLVCTAFGMAAQRQDQISGESSSQRKIYPPGNAWTLSYPLGTRIESTLDTLLYNYQRQFVVALTSDAWASTGQLAGPGINMIYFNRTAPLSFHFDNAIEKWVPTFAKQKFYNVYIPYTQLSYNMGYGTENRTDLLRATFAGNVNKDLGFGAWVDYPYTKGTYANQATKELAFGFTGYYTGARYEMQAFYNHYNHLNKENGGITNDLYITNPAEMQGGVEDIEPISIPVNLHDAHNRVIGNEFYMSHAYKIGFWRDITQPNDTVQREEYVPVTKFVYSFNWKSNKHLFLDTNASEIESFWDHRYFDLQRTEDRATYWSVANTFGIEMIEGFQKWAKFGLAAYATYEFDKYGYDVAGMNAAERNPVLTPLPSDYLNTGESRNRLWVGGRIEKTRGAILRYSADASFGLMGDVVGDIKLQGELRTKFRLFKDTVVISAKGHFKNLEPNYFLNHYTGNNFIWNNNFGKIRSYHAEGHLHIPWSKTDIMVGVENIQNHIYFNASSMPEQYGGNVQVVSASVSQKLRAGIWNWNNTITYQATTNESVLPLPTLSIYSNMFLYFKAFRALTVQVGIDCNYYTKYKGLAYQPATMSFHVQGDNATDIGNFAVANAYLTAKLYKVRLFLMCSHVNQGWFSKNYFSLPHYPIDPRQFRMGLSIDFTN
ncbi:MAG: putative porin [Candidatus Amulumruptor caecigallinarius]|nr:putative porin [Candidatus Amulumruptor caecigallinarius]